MNNNLCKARPGGGASTSLLPLPPHSESCCSNHLFSNSSMVDPSQYSRFRVLLESALQDYQNQTGTTLTSHSLAKKLQGCDSVQSVNAVLQAQARAFRKFRRGDGRITKSLDRLVSVLYALST